MSGSYRLPQLENPEKERARLQEQAQAFVQEELSFLQKAGLRPGIRVLDVGCGGGEMTSQMAKVVGPDGYVLGVDQDETIYPNKSVLPWLEFKTGCVGALSQEPGKFDFITCRFLMQHLADPIGALQNLGELLAPGGRIVLLDSDDGLFFMDPLDKEWNDFLETARNKQKDMGGDRFVGRQLPGLLQQSGFKTLHFQTKIFSSLDVSFPFLFQLVGGYKAALLRRSEQLETLKLRLQQKAHEEGFWFSCGICGAVALKRE